jgi:hypothetical protein
MLVAVEPLLHRIDALPEHGCYSVTFLLDGAHERSIVMKVVDAEVVVPEANLLPGWSGDSPAFVSALGAVRAFNSARNAVDGSAALLRDVPGGWDVGVGNVVLENGQPVCVAHDPMPAGTAAEFECAECGAQALYGATG